MKKIVVGLFGLMLGAGVASATTVKVAEQYLSTTDYTSPNSVQLANFQNLLLQNNIDFAYFHGPESADKFGFTCDGYTVDKSASVSVKNLKDTFIVVYKTAKWTEVGSVEPNVVQNINAACAVIMQNSNGEQFAFILTSGNRWDSAKGSSYFGCVKDVISGVETNYPAAKIIACGMQQKSQYPLTVLASYFDGTKSLQPMGGYTTYYASDANTAAFFVKTENSGFTSVETAVDTTNCQSSGIGYTALGTFTYEGSGDDDPTKLPPEITSVSVDAGNVSAEITVTGDYLNDGTISVRVTGPDYDETLTMDEFGGSVEFTGLASETEYTYIVTATNDNGSDDSDHTDTFTTAATVTLAARAVQDGSVLTFYYDQIDHSGDGIVIYPLGENGERTWGEFTSYWQNDTTISAVIFDESFKNYKPTTCKDWFRAFKNNVGFSGMENLDTSEVTDMSSMFYNCNCGVAPDLTHFNTAKVTTMEGMFAYSGGFEGVLDLSSFDTSLVTSTQNMFNNVQMTTIIVSKLWTNANITSSSNMFSRCAKLTGAKGTKAYLDENKNTPSGNPLDATYARVDKTNAPGYLTLDKPTAGWSILIK